MLTITLNDEQAQTLRLLVKHAYKQLDAQAETLCNMMNDHNYDADEMLEVATLGNDISFNLAHILDKLEGTRK